MDYFLTGYTDLRHSQVTLPTSEEAHASVNILSDLMEQFLDTTQYTYLDCAEKLDGPSGITNENGTSGPFGLQGSMLLSQLPWLTQWPALFEGLEPVKVFQINGICNI